MLNRHLHRLWEIPGQCSTQTVAEPHNPRDNEEGVGEHVDREDVHIELDEELLGKLKDEQARFDAEQTVNFVGIQELFVQFKRSFFVLAANDKQGDETDRVVQVLLNDITELRQLVHVVVVPMDDAHCVVDEREPNIKHREHIQIKSLARSRKQHINEEVANEPPNYWSR